MRREEGAGMILGGRCPSSSYSSLPRGRSKVTSHVTAPPVLWKARGKLREKEKERLYIQIFEE